MSQGSSMFTVNVKLTHETRLIVDLWHRKWKIYFDFGEKEKKNLIRAYIKNVRVKPEPTTYTNTRQNEKLNSKFSRTGIETWRLLQYIKWNFSAFFFRKLSRKKFRNSCNNCKTLFHISNIRTFGTRFLQFLEIPPSSTAILATTYTNHDDFLL